MKTESIDVKNISELERIFAIQKQAFLKDPYPSVAVRRERINRISTMLMNYRQEILKALDEDFGGHSSRSGDLLEIVGMLERIKYNSGQIKKWMKPLPKAGNFVVQGNAKAYIKSHPKGVVGNMVSWNFPFDIGLGPTIDALSAGNRVIIKPSDLAPRCGEVMKKMISDTFEEDLVAVSTGGLDLAIHFPKLAWDHLVYTGSGRVGKLVMKSAAENLVPVTLELGGKSPVIITEESVTDETAKSIAGIKSVKRGQMCVTGDYAFVPENKMSEFVDKLTKQFTTSFGGEDNGALHTCGIISQKHLQRLHGLVEEAVEKGAQVINTGSDMKASGRHMPFHLIINPPEDIGVMQEEIFGPILPVISYKSIDEVIDKINEGDKPLGLYLYSENQKVIDKVCTNTHSGGVAVNVMALQAGQPSVAFGGVGDSGMGVHHGVEGFREFSNQRGYFIKKSGGLFDLILPPYSKKTDNFIENVAYAPLGKQAIFALKALPKNLWSILRRK